MGSPGNPVLLSGAAQGHQGVEPLPEIPELETTGPVLLGKPEPDSKGRSGWLTFGAAAAVLVPLAGVLATGRRRPAAGPHRPGSPRGRPVALGAAGLGVLVIAGTGIISWKEISEGWYLYRLHSTDPESRLRALDRLVEMKSARAVSPLLEIVRKEAGVTQLGSRAALALLILSPDDSFHLYLDEGPSWHSQLADQCRVWVGSFLRPKLEAAIQSRDFLEWHDGTWALGVLRPQRRFLSLPVGQGEVQEGLLSWQN